MSITAERTTPEPIVCNCGAVIGVRANGNTGVDAGHFCPETIVGKNRAFGYDAGYVITPGGSLWDHWLATYEREQVLMPQEAL